MSGPLRLALVVGARPNLMKVAPILRRLTEVDPDRRRIDPVLVHTGQHYDTQMNDAVMADVGLPMPDESLGVGSDSHARQTAKIMVGFEEICSRRRIEAVLVAGDVNSTLACALVAAKLGVLVVHVEAGLRAFDWTMPEEVNRVLTDQIGSLLLTPSSEADENLVREGIAPNRIVCVGNVMIDSLRRALPAVESNQPKWIREVVARGLPVIVATLHRPGNVDDGRSLAGIVRGLEEAGRRAVVLFPIHPRTAKRLQEEGLQLGYAEPKTAPTAVGLYAMPPLGYSEFLGLLRVATLVLTDSGGVQEETTALGVPCATLRPNTERPITVSVGTNELVHCTADGISAAVEKALEGRWKTGAMPPLWDGRAAERVVDELERENWRNR